MTIRLFANRLIARIELATSGYLVQMGWIETRATRMASDRDGRPIPWFTYPAIRFLDDRVCPDWRVLEFGAGAGTRWWAGRSADVSAVEHDAAWADMVSAACSARVFKNSSATASDYLGGILSTGPYDVVVVDGLYRNECLFNAPGLLTARGVIVLDDAQREEYAPAVREVQQRGFRLLELHGPQPVSKHPGCTAILYRDGNLLGL